MSDSSLDFGPIATRVLYEDDQVRIWDQRLAPGEKTAPHRHEQDYVLVDVEGERIGVGAEGIQKIRRHPFFKGFSWTSVLEQTLDMIRPDVEPDVDKGPEDIKTPVKVECLEQPCHLSLAEQELFKDF